MPRHLLRAVDHGREADAAFADGLVELRVGRAGHDIRARGKAREGLADDARKERKRLAVDIDRGRKIIRVEHLGRKSVLFGKRLDDGETFLFALMGDKAHVGAQRRLLRDDIVGVGARTAW